MLAVCLMEAPGSAGTARQGCPRDRRRHRDRDRDGDGDKDGDSPFAAFGGGRSRFPSRWAPAARTGKAELVLQRATVATSL